MDSTHDMRVVNADALSHQNKMTEKWLQTMEKEKNKKYLEAWLQQHHLSIPFTSLLKASLAWMRNIHLKAQPSAS